jgi:5'-nucleotidase/UDP-sugar diphosphatase
MCTLVCALFISAAALSQTDTLTILHFNDTHSNLAPIGPRDANLKGTLGGIARAATLIGMTKMEDPNAIVLHAGDVFIGDLFFNKYFGVAELQIMNAIGFDAMTVGNHEFDFTPATLQMALDTAFQAGGFPLLSANIDLENDTVKSLKNYIRPYIVKQSGNVKVGIFGLTTPLTNLLSLPYPAVVSENFVSAAAAMVDTLNAKNCGVIILLSHLGVYYDQIVAGTVPGINVIVGGHDHFKFDTPKIVKGPTDDTCFIVQANAFYLNSGKMRLAVGAGRVRLLDYQMIDLDANIPEEPGVSAIVEGLVADIDATWDSAFTKRIGYAKADFDEVAIDPMGLGYQDTPIGNLVTDAFREVTKTEIALEVGGSTAERLYAGPLVAADFFRVVGYGYNTENGLGYHLAIMKMTGEAIWKSLEVGLGNIEVDDENLVQASGLTYVYNSTRPVGQRVVSVLVGNQPLDPAREYTVTGNEFVAGILGYYQIPVSDIHVCSGDTTEFQVLLKYVAARDTIEPTHRHGVVNPVFQEKNAAPKSFSLHQNYPNPFNPSTTIAFELPKETRVVLKVFNILGQEVITTIDDVRSAGKHSVVLNASRLSSGMYFYQLRAGDFVQTKKMLLTK